MAPAKDREDRPRNAQGDGIEAGTRLPSVGITPQHDDGERPGVGPVTELRVMGRNARLLLSPSRRSLMLGAADSPEVDLTLDSDGVSRLHAILTRKGPKLRVRDQASTNGTYFKGLRDPDFEIGSGDVFEVTQRIRLLALDDDLCELRRTLQWVLGLRADGAIDDALAVIAQDEQRTPILLAGPRGCDQRALADEIHRRSSRRHCDIVTAPHTFATRAEEDAKLDHGARGTIYLDLTQATESLPNHFVSRLFAESIRPIVVAPDRAHARKCLDTYADRLALITIPALTARRDDIPRLLAALLNHEGVRRNAPLRLPLTELGPDNVDGLKACDWSENIDELRARAVPRLFALLQNDLQLAPTARALGLKQITTLRQALGRMGVRVGQPQLDDRDEVEVAIEVPQAEDEGADELPRPPGT